MTIVLKATSVFALKMLKTNQWYGGAAAQLARDMPNAKALWRTWICESGPGEIDQNSLSDVLPPAGRTQGHFLRGACGVQNANAFCRTAVLIFIQDTQNEKGPHKGTLVKSQQMRDTFSSYPKDTWRGEQDDKSRTGKTRSVEAEDP
ncbi:MAG: hypothetical protein HKN37_14065 [Rhodothermales bacterium]|nr:hypothetical protein [Rhodothermales bacterium]